MESNARAGRRCPSSPLIPGRNDSEDDVWDMDSVQQLLERTLWRAALSPKVKDKLRTERRCPHSFSFPFLFPPHILKVVLKERSGHKA